MTGAFQNGAKKGLADMRSAEEKTGCSLPGTDSGRGRCGDFPRRRVAVRATSCIRIIFFPAGSSSRRWWALYLQPAVVFEVVHVLPVVARSRHAARGGRRVFRLRRPQGPPPPDPRRLRRGHRTLLLHPGARPEDPRGKARGGRQRDGGPPGHRHPLLLLLGGPPLHRVRHLGRPARRDVLLPRLRADGQRSRAGPSLRPVRVEDRGPLPRDGARDRDGIRLGDRASRDGAARGGVGLRDPLRRERRVDGGTPVVAGPGPVRHRRRP